MNQPKRGEYNTEYEDNSPNIQSDKNYHTLSLKFRQIREKYLTPCCREQIIWI